MAVLSCPFVQASYDGASDVSEIAVQHVAVELFQRTGNLYPRVSPCVCAIHTLLVGHILNDIAWMSQRKLQLVTLHGEHAAQSARNSVKATCEMCRIGGYAHIVDEVACGHDGQAVVEQH